MPEITTAEWLTILEAAAQRRPDQANREWEWLMQQLGLGPEYFLAIYEAIRQGRWRTAKNPKAYIKTVAKREALKMGLLCEHSNELVLVGKGQIEGEELSEEEVLDFLSHQQDSAEPTKGPDGVWRAGPGWERDHEGRRDDSGSYRDALVSAVPSEFAFVEPRSEEYESLIDEINGMTDEVHFHPGPVKKPDWPKWAQAAGFDEWERQVLDCKIAGTSRERALASQLDEGSRKALQAAWKRFERSGMERLLAVAKKDSAENVPE